MQFTVALARLNKLTRLHVSVREYCFSVTYVTPQNRPLCEKWKQKYIPVLAQNSTVSQELFENMREYLLKSNDNPSVVDRIILGILQQEKYSDVGISYYKFLKSNNYEVSISTVCTYMELCINKEGPLSTRERDHIYNICNDIMNKYAAYDRYTATVLVNSLCKIDKWQQALKIIENYEGYNDNTPWRAHGTLIAYFFNHGYEEKGYEYLIDIFARGIRLPNEFYYSYFKYCLKEKDSFNKKIEELFNIWDRYGFKPSMSTMLSCIKACNEAGWFAKLTGISNGTCQSCGQTLLDADITDEDFKKLHKVIEETLIFKRMYEVTNPEEMKSFKRFIDKRKPYDFVIDGLNVLCVKQGPDVLKNELTYLKSQRKRVLFIGRQHLHKYIQREGILNLADCFLVENISNDDAFVLYAAFSSKKDTKIVSNDLMRNHEFCIEDKELQATFRKWQTSHQYFSIKEYKSTVKLNFKHLIDAVVQKHGNCWHIPYMEIDHSLTRRHTSTDHWACLNMCP